MLEFGEDTEEDALKRSLTGVDVVINLLGSKAGEMKEKLLTAVAGSAILTYIPSEFGV